jgi:putative peptide zinc metalloprotease protein
MTNPPRDDRALPFRPRDDLRIAPIEAGGDVWYVIKDPLALRYIHLAAPQYRALRTLGGSRSLQDWSERARDPRHGAPGPGTLRDWLREFLGWGLVTRERMRPAGPLTRPRGNPLANLWRGVRNPLYIQLPGWDPSGVLAGLDRRLGWLVSWPCLFVAACFVLLVWGQTLVHGDTFYRRLPGWDSLSRWQTWVSLWVAIGVSKVLHELAHGLVARRMGAECHAMGAALVLFSPALYCDVSDAWCLPRRRQRLAIALAGIVGETVCGAAALAVWWGTRPGWFHDWCWHLTAVTTLSTLAVNLNPLVRYDGYFVLSDLWGIPNLRQQAQRVVDRGIRRVLHGPHDHANEASSSRLTQAGLVLYAGLATGYRLVVLVTMGYALAAILKPWGLESGVWLYAASAVIGLGVTTGQHARRWLSGGRSWRPWLVTAAGLALVGLGGTALWRTPFAWPQQAPFVIEPVDPARVYVTTPGDLAVMHVAAGDHVRIGEPLLELRDPALLRRRLELLVECARREQEVALAKIQQSPAVEVEAAAALATVSDQLAELERRIERLVLRAPRDGVVVPVTMPEPTKSAEDEALPTWSGSPLDAVNHGAWLPAGTEVLIVVPSAARRAVVSVSQSQRPAVRVGATWELQPTGEPRRRQRGMVREISPRTTTDWPSELRANAHTVTNQATADPRHFPVTVLLEADAEDLPYGTTGVARFTTAPLTVGEWSLHQLRQAVPVWW